MVKHSFLTTYWPLILLCGIGAFICVANYTPGTYLSGWDSLHPEFNLPLAWNRALFGVFRPEEGLGTVAGHSHMADIPHLFLLTLLKPLMPLSLIRYTYIFLCYLLGPIGIYFFLRRLFANNLTCFVGALFYMLNIGTIQTFTVPFEMFTTQYTLLPFLFFFATDFLVTHQKRAGIGFLLTTIFLSPIAFAATLWYITTLTFILYLLSFFLFTKFFRKISLSWQSLFLLLGSFFILNLYWILPNLYFIHYHAQDVTKALMNQLFSEEAFLYNASFGNFLSIALIHTFYFHWNIFDGKQFVQLLQTWLQFPFGINNLVGFFFFALACVGFVWSIKRKHTVLLAFFPAIVICLFLLANINLPLHMYIPFTHIPFFQEAFRFPDDKVLGIFIFLYTLFFTAGVFLITKKLAPKFQTISHTLLAISLIFSAFPVFTGHLIQPLMKVTIPQSYFQLFSFMNTQPNGRIITLPSPTIWGWEYYDWNTSTRSGQTVGFQGSGFLPFGLKQATMDRDFDRWNPSNEHYYRELSYAVYTQNKQLFLNVLRKYDISYILIDKSMSTPGYPVNTTFIPQTFTLLNSLSQIKQTKSFGKNLILYTLNTQPPFVSTANLPQADGTMTSFFDSDYMQLGSYVNTGQPADITNNLDQMTQLPFVFQPLSTENLFSFIAHPTTINECSPTGNQSTSIENGGRKQEEKRTITYTSKDSQFCDHVNVVLPQANTPSMLSITAKNISGLSLRLCIADSNTHHCLITTKLPASSSFVTTNFFIPALPTNIYSVNINNIGISPVTAKNSISHIFVTPLSVPNSSPAAQQTSLQPLPATPLANSTIYIVRTPNISPRSFLVLSQSYEPGWHMYAADNAFSELLTIMFPFLFKPVGTHVMVNSWENGWTINQSSLISDQSSIIVIFLPQYLEYLGFILGGASIGISLWIFKKNNRHSELSA